MKEEKYNRELNKWVIVGVMMKSNVTAIDQYFDFAR
jgi:hypothetical protein